MLQLHLLRNRNKKMIWFLFLQGFTALHHAAQLPTKTMVNLLLLFGTDRNRAAKVRLSIMLLSLMLTLSLLLLLQIQFFKITDRALMLNL